MPNPVYFLLDNNLFLAVNEEGGHGPATRDSEGHFHVVGDLVVADPAAQQAVMKLCAPLWEAASSTNMVVVSPLPRYVKHSCCPDAGHIPNRTDPAFYYTLKEELASCATTIKNFLFMSGMRYGRVMDPQRNIKGLTVAEIWDKDPVHPKEEIYSKIADGVLEVERSCGGGGGGSGKRKAASYGSEEDGSQAHRSVRGRVVEGGSHGHNYNNNSPVLPGGHYGRRDGTDYSASLHPGSSSGRGTRRGRGGVDGETGEAESPTAIALTVGAATAAEAMQAEGVTVVDTEAAGEAVAAAAVAATLAAAAGCSAACSWQHYGSTIAVKKSIHIQEYNYIIMID